MKRYRNWPQTRNLPDKIRALSSISADLECLAYELAVDLDPETIAELIVLSAQLDHLTSRVAQDTEQPVMPRGRA